MSKGLLRDCRQITFIMLNRFCLLSNPTPLAHIPLPIGTNGKPLEAIDKFPSVIGKLMIGKTLLPMGRKLPMLRLVMMNWKITDNHW